MCVCIFISKDNVEKEMTIFQTTYNNVESKLDAVVFYITEGNYSFLSLKYDTPRLF